MGARKKEVHCKSIVVPCLLSSERPQKEQLADLRKRWEEMKAAALAEHGTFAHLELPDIRLTHEISYEAPPGTTTAERAMPLPRALVSI